MLIDNKTAIYDYSMILVERTHRKLQKLLASIIGYNSCYLYKGRQYSNFREPASNYTTLPENLYGSMDHYINLEKQFIKDKAVISSYIRKLINECLNLYEFHLLIPQPCLDASQTLSEFLEKATRDTPQFQRYYTSFNMQAFKEQHKHVYELADRWQAKYTMLGV